jgi:hypothetical protein
MLSLSMLSHADKAKASTIFGIPPNRNNPKFTGGDSIMFLKIRRDLMANIRGRNVEDLVDYNIQAAAAPGGIAAFDFGVNGANIVEAIATLPIPNRITMIDTRILQFQASEVLRHDATEAHINANIADPDDQDAALLSEMNTHNSEMNKIDTSIRITLENQYYTQVSDHRKHVKEYEEDQHAVHELFLKHFAGPALDYIIDNLDGRQYMRALYLLDQRYGLTARNLVAGNLLQSEIRSKIFRDDQNLRVQMDNFELILNMLERMNQPLSDEEKIVRLLHALSNGGIIQILFQVQINNLFDPHGDITFLDALRKVNLRLETLSSEAASMKLQYVPAVSMPKGSKAHIAQTVSDSFPVDDNEQLVFLSQSSTHTSKPVSSRPSSQSSNRPVRHCSICNRDGHSNEQCWNSSTCTNCGKTGHISKFCRSRKSSGSDEEKDDKSKTARTESKPKGLAAQVMENVRNMSK